jgi:prepilin-type processing-associated H-X9-DG protein
MNSFLGEGGLSGGAKKRTNITRRHSDVFFFSGENMWPRPGASFPLNDNALCPDGRDWFGTFHGTSQRNRNAGTVNIVFVDAHVDKVRSALKPKPDHLDTSEMEFGKYEKFGWPHKKRPPGL